MERNKKALVGLLLTSLLAFSVVPYFNVQAQSCNPNALMPVSYGQKGNAVRNAQLCLMEAGYDIPAGATGYYGSQTRTAVKNFYADWYGSWSGNSLGSRGVAQLKSILAGGMMPFEKETGGTQPRPSQQASQQDQTAAIVAAVLAALQQMGVVPSATTTKPAGGQEGVLIVEKNPTPANGITFYEGQTQDWVGVRFRAQDSDITVGSFKIVYPQSNNAAPSRIVNKFEVVDESGNVLKTIDPSSFTQDYSTLDYYYYVTGLNYVVPKGGQRSLFVRATAVQTFPSGASNTLTLKVSDVRGRDSAGIDRFPTNVIDNQVTRQTSLATSAYFQVSKNSASPVEKNYIADYATGRADRLPLLMFDLIAKNDRIQLTQVTGSTTFSGTGAVGTVYLMDGSNILDSASVSSNSFTFQNLLSQNIWVDRDGVKTLTIAADVTGATTSVTDVSATVQSVSRKNSLGDAGIQSGLNVSGETLHVFTEAPEFAKGPTFNVAVTRDQNNSTTTANATLEVLITARGGNIKISSTTVFSIFRETSAGATSTAMKAASEVRDSSGNIVSQTNGYYVIPVNQTYKFVIQDSTTYAGAARIRYKVGSIVWQNSASNNVTSSWTGRDLITDWSN